MDEVDDITEDIKVVNSSNADPLQRGQWGGKIEFVFSCLSYAVRLVVCSLYLFFLHATLCSGWIGQCVALSLFMLWQWGRRILASFYYHVAGGRHTHRVFRNLHGAIYVCRAYHCLEGGTIFYRCVIFYGSLHSECIVELSYKFL